MPRDISIENYFHHIGQSHQPTFRFAGTTADDFSKWKAELFPRVIASLGKSPEKVPLNPEIEWEKKEDGLIKRRVWIDVEEGLSVPALVFRLENAKGKLPAILCCHGHGPFGKEAVMGHEIDREMGANIRECNYNYGLKMAQAGFVTMAIDWRGFGERDERQTNATFKSHAGQRDICNIHYIRATLLGMTVLGMDLHDARCAIDYLETLDFVDRNKIGVMGLSFGGTMTTWIGLSDPRIKATDIICYSDRFASFGLERINFCGSQITPGLFELCDVPDLHGLIAPRPLLVEIGKHDTCFLPEQAMSCFREVEKIYIAAGAHEKLVLDHFDGGHQWGGNLSVQFFRKYLA